MKKVRALQVGDHGPHGFATEDIRAGAAVVFEDESEWLPTIDIEPLYSRKHEQMTPWWKRAAYWLKPVRMSPSNLEEAHRLSSRMVYMTDDEVTEKLKSILRGDHE
jgi:hypothetical protein